MKYLIFFFAFLTFHANAQEYSYQISQDSAGLFTLEVISQSTPTRAEISRTTQLDSATLQGQQYARIEQAYNEVASAEIRSLSSLRKANVLRQSLASVGLEDYNTATFAKYDSLFAAPAGVWAVQGQAPIQVWVQYREGSTQVIRRLEDNAAVGVILPLSQRYVQINIQPAFQVDGQTFVRMASSDGQTFYGQGADFKTYLLRLRR